jgi:hypothetical protein
MGTLRAILNYWTEIIWGAIKGTGKYLLVHWWQSILFAFFTTAVAVTRRWLEGDKVLSEYLKSLREGSIDVLIVALGAFAIRMFIYQPYAKKKRLQEEFERRIADKDLEIGERIGVIEQLRREKEQLLSGPPKAEMLSAKQLAEYLIAHSVADINRQNWTNELVEEIRVRANDRRLKVWGRRDNNHLPEPIDPELFISHTFDNLNAMLQYASQGLSLDDFDEAFVTIRKKEEIWNDKKVNPTFIGVAFHAQFVRNIWPDN